MRLLLEADDEPQFSDRSHGFRKEPRVPYRAAGDSSDTWTGTTWFIEADIADCFGTLDHDVMLAILSENIHENRFLRLIRNMLKAGYLEDWEYRDTLSGCPARRRGHAPNTVGNFCFEVTLGYRRLERGR